MSDSNNRHDKVFEKILLGAHRLFNRHGFNAVSIDDVMAEVGLTRGGFYSYFSSKSELYAQSVARVIDHKRAAANGQVSAAQIIRDHLSARHCESIDGAWPIIGLPGDIARTDRDVRQAFESALRAMVEIFEQDLAPRSMAAGGHALAIAALCAGGMALAQAVEDRNFADELRRAALAAALSLGGWN